MITLATLLIAVHPGQLPKEPQSRFDTSGAAEKSDEYKSLFRKTAPSLLRNDPNDEVALFARWEWLRTPPLAADRIEHQLDISHFLGYIEGRLRVEFSKRMKDLYRSNFQGQPRLISFRRNRDLPMTPNGLVLSRQGESARFKQGNVVVEVPIRTIKDFWKGIIDIAIDGDHAFIVSYTGDARLRYRVGCVDLSNHSLVWSSWVWANGLDSPHFYFHSGPLPQQIVTLCVTDAGLVVLGAASGGGYIERFNKSSGKCDLRFSTVFWNQRSPQSKRIRALKKEGDHETTR